MPSPSPTLSALSCLLALAAPVAVSAADAIADPLSAARTRHILVQAVEAVGIAPLLDSVLPALDAELGTACGASDAHARSALFATDALLEVFIDSLVAHGDAAWLSGVQAWYGSAAGRAIARHEADAVSLDEAAVERAFQVIAERADWPQRRALLRASLKSTGTASFLTRLHQGVDGIIAAASNCTPDPEALDELAGARDRAREDEAFIALFLGIELIAPTAVIYDGLPDRTLRDYRDFAQSPAGARWFQVLHRAMDAALDGARERLMAERMGE